MNSEKDTNINKLILVVIIIFIIGNYLPYQVGVLSSLLLFYLIYQSEPDFFQEIINPIIKESEEKTNTDKRQLLDLWKSTSDFRKNLKNHSSVFKEIGKKLKVFINQIEDLKTGSHYPHQVYGQARDNADYILDTMSSVIVMMKPSFSPEGRRDQILEDYWREKIRNFSGLFDTILGKRRQIINLEWKTNPNIEISPISPYEDPKPNGNDGYDYYTNFNLH